MPFIYNISMKNWKDNIYFVLVEPEEPGNIGASARALKNMGFKNLCLVNPPVLTEEARWFAHLALDVLDSAVTYDSIKDALSNKHIVIGTTRRKGKKRGVYRNLADGMEDIASLAQSHRIAVVFGREKKGLSNEEALECAYLYSIPADKEHPSLNLSHAVTVVAYELAKAGFGSEGREGHKNHIVTHGELEILYSRLERAIKLLDYNSKGDRDPEESTLRQLKRVMGRAGISRQELNMFHGICSQIEIKLGHREPGHES